MFRLRVLLMVGCVFLLALPVIAQDNLIALGSSDALGDFLVGPDGLTLYMFTPDPLDVTFCYDQCADNWPSLRVESAAEVTVAEGIPGEFSTIERTDGDLQVTYNGMPLYYWVRDEAPGDTDGQGRGNVWWVLPPATVYAFRHGDLAPMLVGPTGMTLYTFANDEMGVSNCVDQCVDNWPPLLVDSAEDIVPGVNLIGTLDVTERTDGTLQVTYNDMPLYYWKDDAVRGDMDGEGRGDVWFTVAPEALSFISNDALGDFLIAANGMTVYMFANDEEGVSNCVDQCAENWPPMIVNPDDPLVGGPHLMGELGTITRIDDLIQVTYNGMPLYFWKDDVAPGDTNGHGVGDVWSVVAP
jgi:predicted lipoprotein with Yx(FWY)xxD motif